MDKAVMKRIEALEKASKSKNLPFLIIGDSNNEGQWEVSEHYDFPVHHIKKQIYQNQEEYEPPEGFEGVYIIGILKV